MKMPAKSEAEEKVLPMEEAVDKALEWKDVMSCVDTEEKLDKNNGQ